MRWQIKAEFNRVEALDLAGLTVPGVRQLHDPAFPEIGRPRCDGSPQTTRRRA